MSAIKEYREFFLRNVAVTSGAKKDQETGYPLQYIITGIGSVFNRFLKSNYPSEDVNKKLFESITFKLNPEDTANLIEQGLVRVATDVEGIARTSSGAGVFTNVVKPHQLPDIVLTTDGSDTLIGTPVEVGGLKLSILTRLVSGLSWRNFKLEVNRDKSIVIEATSKKIELDGDLTSPGNSKLYGTNASGIKGWYAIPVQTLPIYYSIYASYINSTGNNTGNGIGVYVLHNENITASTLVDDGDEAKYELTGLYTDSGTIANGLWVNGILTRTFDTQSTDPVYQIIEYTIIYKGTNLAYLITKVHKYGDAGNSTEIYFDTIAFDPTIANTVEYKVTTAIVGANQFSLKRAKLTYGKIL